MRICLVYDCLFPHTVGGAERWYRSLAERLASEGHEVTYLTLRQWARGVPHGVAGVDVRVVGPRMKLYSGPGQRRILPPLVFGIGVLWHLLRHGRSYDVVHTASFPYFSLLAAAAARPAGGYHVFADWHEVWTRAYWRDYLGTAAGDVGWCIQRLCALVRQRAFCFSRLHADRLRAQGYPGEVTILPGEYAGPRHPPVSDHVEVPLVLFAGRHIPEKQVPTIPPAVALARREIPDVRAVILGDGPERERVIAAVRALGLRDAVETPGFVATEVVDDLMGRALCLLLPSRREGYGLVVLEAAARGTPSVVVAGPDNAAVELVDEDENGYVAASASPEDLSKAIIRVHAAGPQLRRRTADWFSRNLDRLSLEHSLELVLAAYAAERAARS